MIIRFTPEEIKEAGKDGDSSRFYEYTGLIIESNQLEEHPYYGCFSMGHMPKEPYYSLAFYDWNWLTRKTDTPHYYKIIKKLGQI